MLFEFPENYSSLVSPKCISGFLWLFKIIYKILFYNYQQLHHHLLFNLICSVSIVILALGKARQEAKSGLRCLPVLDDAIFNKKVIKYKESTHAAIVDATFTHSHSRQAHCLLSNPTEVCLLKFTASSPLIG